MLSSAFSWFFRSDTISISSAPGGPFLKRKFVYLIKNIADNIHVCYNLVSSSLASSLLSFDVEMESCSMKLYDYH
jgi:hypothetical protein